jgi:putative DNA primase/helicase
MLARVTDAFTAEPMSLHFTRLNPDSTKSVDVPKRLLAGHRKAGGVIRLWPDECVTRGLGIGEGIETCLAAAHGFTPIWCTVDAGNMAAFPVLAGIDALTCTGARF